MNPKETLPGMFAAGAATFLLGLAAINFLSGSALDLGFTEEQLQVPLFVALGVMVVGLLLICVYVYHARYDNLGE